MLLDYPYPPHVCKVAGQTDRGEKRKKKVPRESLAKGKKQAVSPKPQSVSMGENYVVNTAPGWLPWKSAEVEVATTYCNL